MESLPDNVVTKIAAYLYSKDLLVCSSVCKKWREKFNTDSVWAPRLIFPEEYYNIQVKFKDMILCPPDFSTLQPLCTARECYIRDQCLHFNLRAGLFTTESFVPKADGKVYQIVNHIDKDGHYWIFLLFAQLVEVWNITNKPYFQTCAVKKLSVNLDSLYVLGTKVLVVCNNFVEIFSFENPKYELIPQWCLFLDHESPPMDVQEVCKVNFNQFLSKHVLVGNILIGYPGVITKSMLPTTRLHVWNMDILVKLEAVKIIYEATSPCFDDEEDLDTKYLISFQLFKGDHKKLSLITNEMTGCSVSIFDLEELKFLHIKPYSKVQIYWSKVVDERVHLIAALQKITFFATTVDFHGNDGVIKNLTKTTGLDFTCQFSTYDKGVYAKTSSDLWFIGDKEGSLTISKLLDDNFEHNKAANFVVAGHFLFSRSEDGQTKMWDLDNKWQINELPVDFGSIDVLRLSCLQNVDFPPKVIFTNTEGSSVYVLSYW